MRLKWNEDSKVNFTNFTKFINFIKKGLEKIMKRVRRNSVIAMALSRVTKRVQSLLGSPSVLSFLYGMLGASIILLFFVVLFFPRDFSHSCLNSANRLRGSAVKPIVKVNTDQIIQRVVERLNQQGLRDEESITVEARVFGKKLVNTLKQYAREKNVIILPSNLVISEETDITDEIIDELEEQTNEGIKAKERREE